MVAMSMAGAWMGARRTHYGVTNKRLLIVKSGFWQNSRHWNLTELNALDRVEKADGSGNLVVCRERVNYGEGVELHVHGFYGIPEVRKVEALIAELKRKADHAR